MDRTILVSLNGHPQPYRLDEAAYGRLTAWLDGAARRLQADPDREEILADLERSVGDRLAALTGGTDRIVNAAEMDTILDAIGTVDGGVEPPPAEDAPRPKRKLQRIRKGQEIAGVCNGIAEYSQIGVDWVRTVFVLATLVTAGAFAIVYIVLAFVLPVADPEPARR
ncbi:MAG: PspC domain-containing protein [Ilumatobacteraceae bacterium]